MLSKCANPACSAQFKYLHQGKLFTLSPTPNLQSCKHGSLEFLYERFWLCDSCCKAMTVVWGGTGAKIVPLPEKGIERKPAGSAESVPDQLVKSRFAHVGFDTD